MSGYAADRVLVAEVPPDWIGGSVVGQALQLMRLDFSKTDLHRSIIGQALH